MDSHGLWPSDLSEAEQELLKGQLKAKIKETAEQTAKIAGSIPGEFAGILEKIKDKPAIFNWKKYMRKMIGNTISDEITLTRMRPNKRFPEARSFEFTPQDYRSVELRGKSNKQLIEECNNNLEKICELPIDMKSKLHMCVEVDKMLYTNFIRNEGQTSYKYSETCG